ncbi:NAD-dependent epimerase/dehydratase family protein [candidate division WOR-3 bacterium]|nr:NAD-dependent epimerase/dehydratase family protein [candidate division WOR-3 bacterium]
MMKIGITGQSGFMGTHLYNYLGLQKNVERIEFKDNYFENEEKLNEFVVQCDVIVHLAAMNRHNDPQVIYNTNIKLVKLLISAMEETNSTPHVIFSSSTQEERDNPYGLSKKEGRKLFIEWAKKNNALFTGLVIPNVFGPFGKPFYNSVVSTFAYQITHNEAPAIEVDNEMKLIYILDLVKKIYETIINKEYKDEYLIDYTGRAKVTEILEKFKYYQNTYTLNGIFPKLDNYFDLCYFNTFRSYLDSDYFPRNYTLHTDERGSFVEITKTLGQGQFSFSTTKPGITRGNHFYTRKVERFAVIKGEALIQLRRIGTNKVIEYKLSGDTPGYVDMPVWYTHNITNIGKNDLFTLFWTNEFYDPEDPDTYYEKV